jgi:hypothetical protein
VTPRLSRTAFGLAALIVSLPVVVYVARAAVDSHRSDQPLVALSASVTPAARTVTAGGMATYTIRFRGVPGRVSARVVSRLPRSARARVVHRRSSRSWVLQIRTDSRRTPAGTYRVRLRIKRGSRARTTVLKLKVNSAASAGFTISGDVGVLQPGANEPIDLSLSNPNSQPITVDSVTVTAQTVSAPGASVWFPCTLDDFSVQQFSGQYPLVIPANTTLAMSDLGIPSSDWPQLGFRDRPVNQDGCQGASITVSYQGTATTG